MYHSILMFGLKTPAFIIVGKEITIHVSEHTISRNKRCTVRCTL